MNEELAIEKDQARLSVLGNSYPDEQTSSGDGDDLVVELIDILEELDIDLPDIDDWDDIPTIIGLDDDDKPVLIYVDPITGELDTWDLDDLDWDDFIDNYDIDWEIGIDITDGLDLVEVDDDLKIKVSNLPEGIEIVTMPQRIQYIEGMPIDLTGLVVKAIKEDGSTWTSAKYPNGHIPIGELIVSPSSATEEGKMLHNIDYGFFCHLSTNFYDRTFTKTSWGAAFAGMIASPDGWHNPFIVSENPDAVRWHCEDVKSPSFTRDFGISGSATIHGLTVYYGSGYGLAEGPSGTGLSASGIDVFYGTFSELLNAIVAGDGEGKVGLKWLRPGDGKELWTSFNIEVLPRGGGGGR